jgi:hypothetical protein
VIPYALALIVAAALWPLWAEARRAAGPGRRLAWRGLGLGVPVATFVLAGAVEPPPHREPTDRPIERMGGGDFASSDRCRACHPEHDASWRASFHRTMTQPATPERVIPTIDSLEFDHHGDRLRLERRGDRYFAGILAGAEGWVEREVVQTTGSHHFQTFWFTSGRGRELTLFPMCWRIDEAIWMPLDAAFLMPPEHRQALGGARWNTVCVSCHTTGPELRLRAPTGVDTRVAEFGIACEACHGPAEAHVAANRNPLHRYRGRLGGADPSITNPAELSPQRSAEVCGQCHAVSVERAALAERWAASGPSYRPGDELAATRIVVEKHRQDDPELRPHLERAPELLDSTFWSDGQIRLSGREYHGLVASPCYARGDGQRTMTCLSCHVLHRPTDDPRPLAEWADDQLGLGMRGDSACTQCHPRFRDERELVAHTRHAPDSSGSRCYDCHMPYTSYGLLKAIRSHTVTSPSVQETLATGRPNACNLCHLDRTLDWAADRLHEWWGVERPALDDEQRSVAASILWALRGDAGQRALLAWNMGRDEALAASGSDWVTPYLVELMRDPYHAVRFVAARSLRSVRGRDTPGYDFLGDPAARDLALARIVTEWSAAAPARRGHDLGRLLIDSNGGLRVDVVRALLAGRDHRHVYLGE